MLNLDKEIEELEESLARLEKNINDIEFEKNQYHEGIKRAIKKQNIKQNIQLMLNVVLAKMGRIPYCSVDDFRKDMRIRQDIQVMRNQLAALSCSKAIVLKDEENYVPKEVHEPSLEKDIDIEPLKKGYIAIVVNSLDRGGLEQVVGLLAQEFYKKNIPIKVLCLDDGGLMAERLKQVGIEVLIFHGKGHAFKTYIRKNPPSLVNTHYVKRHIKFLHKEGIPIVEVVHNMYVYYCDHVAEIERENEKYYTKLIAVSEIVKETYCNRIKQSDKIAVIGNAAILREEPQKTREEVRAFLGIPQEAYVILNVGSIDPRKNQVGIITAFDIVAKLVEVPVYLVLAGNVQDEAYNNKVLDSISKCEHKTNIICLPYYERVRELYQLADVFVLDSYYEGWSISATEALYDGLPIIHSMCGSAVELVGNGMYGMVVPNPAGNLSKIRNLELIEEINRGEIHNTKELVQAIKTMISSKEYWTEKRTEIRWNMQKKYSVDYMIYCYIKLFFNIKVGD